MAGFGSLQCFTECQNTELFAIIGNNPDFVGADGVVDVNCCRFWSGYGGTSSYMRA